MNKEYREMTPEERLSVINAAMKKDGFVELKNIIDQFEVALAKKETFSFEIPEAPVNVTDENIKSIREIINNSGLAGFTNIQNESDYEQVTPNYDTSNKTDIEKGSIYAAEHREEAMAENGISTVVKTEELEQPKARVLSPTPNLWGDVEIVTPGQLKL